MGIEWKGADFKQSIEKATEEKYWTLFDGVLEVGLRAIEEVVPVMRDIIDNTWSDITGWPFDGDERHKDNRNFSGEMFRDITTAGSWEGNRVYSATAGWVHRFQPYYATQEYGGMSKGLIHYADHYISPMHALTDAYFNFREELEDGLGHIRA